MDHAAFLKGIDIFASLSDQELERLTGAMREESFPQDTVVFAENSTGDKIYIVREGFIDIGKRGEDNSSPVTLGRLGRGEVVGELSIFDEKPRSAGALAAGPGNTVLLSISKPDLDRLMAQDQTLAVKVLRGILQKVISRLRLADDVISILAKMNTALERIKRLTMPS